MSKRLDRIKTMAEKLPPGIGRCLAAAPFPLRLGPTYGHTRREMLRVLQMHNNDIRDYVLTRIANLLPIARECSFWAKRLPLALKTLDDFKAIPLTSKTDLQGIPLEDRSVRTTGCMKINTGGTTGQPLSFYIDRQAFAREWAHMHYIWEKAGYRRTDLKLTLRGRIMGDQPLRYNAVHNEYALHPYMPPDRQAAAVEKVAHKIRYIHGYPSFVYSFLKYCDNSRPEVIGRLKQSLKGVLLGSEYPAPVYRDFIDQVTGVPSVSWYGHSEMAVLAMERERGVYVPLQSYGYAEAVPSEVAGESRLIGTAYFNTASPFIRYDTGDLVEAHIEDGLLKSFRIHSGRVGEFVRDKKGHDISLTALIFGRHHHLFEFANHVQVRQTTPGRAKLVVTLANASGMTQASVLDAFDSTGIDMDFTVTIVDAPMRSDSGKIPLLITGPRS